MSAFSFLVGGVLPYVALIVFLAGMIYRLKVWFKTPQPGKMTLFTNQGESTAKSVIGEALFFPSLFRGDKTLWFFAWVFHVTLALVFLGHVRVFTGLADSMMMSLGMSKEGIDTLSSTTGGGAGILLLATGAVLLIRRFVTKRVREISGAPDFLALFLLLAIIVTGDIMRFSGEHFDLAETRVWAASLLTFSPKIPGNQMFLLHAMMAQLLIIYIPFSKILHFGGIFFTQALVKRR